MKFSEQQVTALQAKLDPSHVAQREQAGRKLSYIEGWHAIAEANRIFGFDAWNRETLVLQETSRDLVKVKGYGGKPDYEQWRVSFLARVRITIGDIVREGTGYGSGMSKPEALGDAIESAAKEAETDAMKRALMTFGNPFGLALYDKSQANVGREVPGSVPMPESERQLRDGLKTNKQTGRTSANSLKQDKSPDNWDAFLQELQECETTSRLTSLALAWSSISTRDNWPTSWHSLAKEKINQRREEIINGIVPDEQSDFPGDANYVPRERSVLEAG